MLAELHVRNFAIIDHLDLAFAPGLNVLTGETGAGKSIIIDAVSSLLGGRAAVEWIRAGAEAAQIEGVFNLSPDLAQRLQPLLEQHGLDDEPDSPLLTLAREYRRSGRNICRINGRTVSLNILGEIGNELVDIHGQSDHMVLLRVKEHVNLLDRYADLTSQVAEVAEQVRSLRNVRRDLAALRKDARDLARRVDLLTYQVEEIEAARLRDGEEAELESERRRLGNAEALTLQADAAVQALSASDSESSGALDLLGQAITRLQKLARIDPDLNALVDEAQALAEQLQDVAAQVSDYREQIEFNPERLAEVEERIDLIHRLKRKYGDSIAEIIAYGVQARTELDNITHSEERQAELQAKEEKLLRRIGKMAEQLSVARKAAAERLARAVEAELGDLRMSRARFGVNIQWQDDPDGVYVGERRLAVESNGIDRVEFLVSANPGEPLRPLARVASGGETARLMLALKTVLSEADATPTLVFDEIDVGIGGRVGSVVGRKLWGLTIGHQVLCITHMAQLAAYGDLHLTVSKLLNADRTTTAVASLEGSARIGELAAMLGTVSESGLETARQMMAEVRADKQSAVRSLGQRQVVRSA